MGVRNDITAFVHDKAAADRIGRTRRQLAPEKIHYIFGIARGRIAFCRHLRHLALGIDIDDRRFDGLYNFGE